MTRTRMVFFTILAVFLAIIAISIAMQIISESFLRQIFIAGTVFGVGVVALDFMGIFGASQSGDAGVEGSLDADSGLGDSDAGGGDADLDADLDADSDGNGDTGPNLVLSVLTYLRLLVYFCLGFGPVGLVALLSGRGGLVALLLAVPVGVVAVFLAQAFFRFQQSDTDSTVQGKELLMREGTVTVPLTHTTMGRVRVQLGMSVVEQFALAEDAAGDFKRGETVRVVRVTSDCIYVR